MKIWLWIGEGYTEVKPRLRLRLNLRLRLRLRQIPFSYVSVPVIVRYFPAVGTVVQSKVYLKLYVGLIFQLRSDQLPKVGNLVIIFVFFSQEVPTIGIKQTIVCKCKRKYRE